MSSTFAGTPLRTAPRAAAPARSGAVRVNALFKAKTAPVKATKGNKASGVPHRGGGGALECRWRGIGGDRRPAGLAGRAGGRASRRPASEGPPTPGAGGPPLGPRTDPPSPEAVVETITRASTAAFGGERAGAGGDGD